MQVLTLHYMIHIMLLGIFITCYQWALFLQFLPPFHGHSHVALEPVRPMLQAILLDVDGTLAKSEVMHRRAFPSAFTERGRNVDWSAPEYRDLLKVTGGKERIAAYLDSRAAALSEPQIHALHHAEAIAIEDSPAGIAAARDAGIAVVATPGLYIDGGDFSRADGVLPHRGDPDQPWEVAVLGGARRWVQISDLQRLAATWEITPRTELAQ